MELADFVQGFATGMKNADTEAPTAGNARTGKLYQAGIGPHTEHQTITLALSKCNQDVLKSAQREVAYPSASRNACDVVIHDGPEAWAIEVKMLRMMGDNGKPNDNMLMHILSPYPQHRSALTDCTKLLHSGFDSRKAIVIFGYDYPEFPMQPAIDAFEALASHQVNLQRAETSHIDDLIHPVHRKGAVYGWEIVGQ